VNIPSYLSRYNRPALWAIAALCALICISHTLHATAANSNQTIAQAFHIAKGSQVVTGAIVSTTPNNPDKVELATSQNVQRLAGVIDAYPLVVISASEDGAHVVLSGTVSVLVSDINGPINASDKITASPLEGIGMRATSDTQVVGTALQSFKTSTAQTRTLTDKSGKKHTIHVGYVALQVGTAYYQAPGSNFLPPFVQRTANMLAGRPVSLLRILTCSILLLVSFIGVTALVYAATRSAMISLGRNPLAAHDIRKSLYQVIAVAAATAAATLLAAYLVLVT